MVDWRYFGLGAVSLLALFAQFEASTALIPLTIGLTLLVVLAATVIGVEIQCRFSSQPTLIGALVLGSGTGGLLSFLGCFLGVGVWPALLLVFVFGVYLFPNIYTLGRPKISSVSWIIILIMSSYGLTDLIMPPRDTDELYYHLPLAKSLWKNGVLIGGELRPNGSRPMLLHAWYALLWGVGKHIAIGVFHLIMSVCVGLWVAVEADKRSLGGGSIALLLLFGSYSWLHAVGIIGSDIPVAAALVAAWSSTSPIVLGLYLGLALSWKYTAIFLVLAVIMLRSKGLKSIAKIGVCISVLILLGFLPNWIMGYHPLFPFTGWALDMPFQNLSRYGMGQGWKDYLMLPVNAVLFGDPNGFKFLGRLNLLWVMVFPSLLYTRRYPKLSICVVMGCIGWSIGPQLLRHFLLVMPFGAVLIGAVWAQNKYLKWGAILIFTVGLSSNWYPLLEDEIERREERYKGPCVDAAQQASKTLPQSAHFALFYCWSGYELEQEYVLSSVEDHIPVRHWILKHKERAVDALREEGIDFVIIGPDPFRNKPYDGLTAEEWEKFYKRPYEILDDLLTKEGVLVMQVGSARIIRLRKK